MLVQLLEGTVLGDAVVEGTFKDVIAALILPSESERKIIRNVVNLFKRHSDASIAEDVKYLIGNKLGDRGFEVPKGWKSGGLTYDEVEFCKDGVSAALRQMMRDTPLLNNSLRGGHMARVKITSSTGEEVSFVAVYTPDKIFGVWMLTYRGAIGAGRTYRIIPVYLCTMWYPDHGGVYGPLEAKYDIRKYGKD